MPRGTKRAAEVDDEDGPPRTQRRDRRRTQQANDDSDGEQVAATQNGGDGDTTEVLIKKLVRYALACEYSRQSIRRDGIREKVIGQHGRGHSFKNIFEGAQQELRVKFGMQMKELPTREKVTMQERRVAAQKNASHSSTASSNAYALVSILPSAYRNPKIIPPSNVPIAWNEATYVGLYTTIIALISLSGGAITEGKLDRYLKRLNADANMAFNETTPKMLARMTKDGYIVKTKEQIANGQEEITEWRVGPRGKVEVGNKGVKGLVEHVYGENAPEDLAKRIQSSLGLEPVINDDEDDEVANGNQENGEETGGSRRRGGRQSQQLDEDDE